MAMQVTPPKGRATRAMRSCVLLVRIHRVESDAVQNDGETWTLSCESGRPKTAYDTRPAAPTHGVVVVGETFEFKNVLRRVTSPRRGSTRTEGGSVHPLPVKANLTRSKKTGRAEPLGSFVFEVLRAAQEGYEGTVEQLPPIELSGSDDVSGVLIASAAVCLSTEPKDLQALRVALERGDSSSIRRSPGDTPQDSRAASPSPRESEGARAVVGDRVECCADTEEPGAEYLPGVVRFVGRTHFADAHVPIWYGVELDHVSGNCDGTAEGHVYFRCPPGRGAFFPPACVTLLTEFSPPMGNSPTSETLMDVRPEPRAGLQRIDRRVEEIKVPTPRRGDSPRAKPRQLPLSEERVPTNRGEDSPRAKPR
eukprot:Hpha_TRINITY_DN7806_c0_g1::TRINITY_DN7806_c0_g1_i1::g.185591::m.185591